MWCCYTARASACRKIDLTMIKKLYLILLLLGAPAYGYVADAQDAETVTTLFPYPRVPDDIVDFGERADYFVTHFWDECRLKSEFSSHQRFAEAFNDYVSMLPHATAEVALESVNKLIEKTRKSSPANLLTLGEVAEAALYDGGAGYVSDELYYPFAKAVADAKKVSSADKARFALQARVLGATQVGMVAPDFKYTDADGVGHSFSERPRRYTILFINDPDCDECRLARVRLATNFYVNQYIDSGQLQVFSIFPGEYSEEWAAEARSAAGDNWIVGACPDLDEVYDMRTYPTVYYLSMDGKILSKSEDIEILLNGFYGVYSRSAGE